MAEVTVFVDDAVLGRLPDVCAKSGVPTTDRLRIVEEIGASTRLGILWLLALAGPVGWVVLLVLAQRDRGERLTVLVPCSDHVYGRLRAGRRLRDGGIVVGVLGTIAMLALTAWADLAQSGFVLTAALAIAAFAAVCTGSWQCRHASIDVGLDASRRWVTLGRVHPAFVDAARAQTAARR